jgi:cold shock CspA family protein
MIGKVDRIAPRGGFGFITGEGEEFFFHRSALKGIEFEELAPGSDVEFEIAQETDGDKPGEHRRAVNVHLTAGEVPAVDNEELPPEKVA